jgi:two-component system, sensor histidine kinase and response regulator
VNQFDPGYLEDMSGGDDEFVRDIISTFLENAQKLVDSLTTAASENNVEKAIYAAHTLKGSSRSVGANLLGDLCEELEKLARSGDMDGFRTLAGRVPEIFGLLGVELAVVLRPQAA